MTSLQAAISFRTIATSPKLGPYINQGAPPVAFEMVPTIEAKAMGVLLAVVYTLATKAIFPVEPFAVIVGYMMFPNVPQYTLKAHTQHGQADQHVLTIDFLGLAMTQ
jgi:hypothetical protein